MSGPRGREPGPVFDDGDVRPETPERLRHLHADRPTARTSRCPGSSVCEKTVSFVQYGTSVIPSTGGREGLEPVAMIPPPSRSDDPRPRRPSWSSTKRGDPNRTSAAP